MNSINILHLSHTDIRFDSRILKEMRALDNPEKNISVQGIGVEMSEGNSQSSQRSDFKITSINLKSRGLTFLPNTFRHFLTMLELTGKMFFKSLWVKPDVIHCNDTLALPLGVLLKLFSRSKLIYDAHELESDRNGLSKTLSKLTLIAEKMAWPFIDTLITVSPSIDQWYMDKFGEKESEIILNSPLLRSDSEPEEQENNSYFRDKYSIPANSLIFIYVGILGEGRGIEKIIDAFSKKVKQSHVVFMGYGALTESIQQTTKESSNIHFHQAVPHEQVVDIIKSADVGLCLIENVSLSDYYCLPNKLFEYSFAEIPVLASLFPDISQTVDKYNLGKCSKLDPNSIYEAIKEIEEANGLLKINSNDLYELSWEAQEEKIIKLYNKLLK